MDDRISLFIGKCLALMMPVLSLAGCRTGAHRDSAANVLADGSLGAPNVDSDGVCVRPAMWVDLTRLP